MVQFGSIVTGNLLFGCGQLWVLSSRYQPSPMPRGQAPRATLILILTLASRTGCRCIQLYMILLRSSNIPAVNHELGFRHAVVDTLDHVRVCTSCDCRTAPCSLRLLSPSKRIKVHRMISVSLRFAPFLSWLSQRRSFPEPNSWAAGLHDTVRWTILEPTFIAKSLLGRTWSSTHNHAS